MQRKGLDPGRIEEGRSPVIIASNSSYAEDDNWRRRQVPPPRQGWNPVTVILVAAVLLSLCFGWYSFEQAATMKTTIRELSASHVAKQTEYAKAMVASKHRIDELETFRKQAEESEKDYQARVKALHEEMTALKHDLHEEQAKSRRMHRDNLDLHKKLKVKSAELKVLEDQTHAFGKEMDQLTKTIHALQGEAQQEGESTTDYEALYKKQEEQQKRYEQSRKGGHGHPSGMNHRKGSVMVREENVTPEAEVVMLDETTDVAEDDILNGPHEY